VRIRGPRGASSRLPLAVLPIALPAPLARGLIFGISGKGSYQGLRMPPDKDERTRERARARGSAFPSPITKYLERDLAEGRKRDPPLRAGQNKVSGDLDGVA
jgi:hypothetical protein